jgi:primosomal protein N' (replication factor Y)
MLAKGHHFPRLTLVVIVDTDMGFYHHDFRALEQLGQLITQVAGRAGRAEEAGEVLIQTHLPQHPLLNLLLKEGYEAFAQSLLAMRAEAELPPYQYLANIRCRGKNMEKLVDMLIQVKKFLQPFSIQIYGPAPAPLTRISNQYRMQLLLKAKSRKTLQYALTSLREWITMNKLFNGIRWLIDVDPLDLS